MKMRYQHSGFSLVELVIAVVVLGILSTMVVAAGVASQEKARYSVALNDVDSFKNAVYQACITYPDMIKYTDSQPKGSIAQIVTNINEYLDESFKLTMLSDNQYHSGAVAYTAEHRDPWGNAYGLYIYTDEVCTGYASKNVGYAMQDGYTTSSHTLYNSHSNMLYIAFTSAGPNGSGGPAGWDGGNIDLGNGSVKRASEMINNSDGIDDIGIILRVRDGDISFASFGTDLATLGRLKNTQWIYGPITTTSGGKYYDFISDVGGIPRQRTGIREGGSLDVFGSKNDIDAARSPSGLLATKNYVGVWSAI